MMLWDSFVFPFLSVASKHFETKKFYILYNQLEDTRIHLEKELSLLDSILNNFNQWVSLFVPSEHFLVEDFFSRPVRWPHHKPKINLWASLNR